VFLVILYYNYTMNHSKTHNKKTNLKKVKKDFN